MKKLIKIPLTTVIFILVAYVILMCITSCGTQGRCDGVYHPAMQDRN